MFLIKFKHVINLLLFFQLCYTQRPQRRILQGLEIQKDKPYTVYLIKAPPSPRQYIGWMCGGAIVTEWYIITAAACVQDVQHLYAIAGYKKYVKSADVDLDPCTKNHKKKVVFTCVPRSYNFEFHKIESWAHIDIAIIKVESPYNFNDESYASQCSYKPAKIEVNYEKKYQEPGVDAMVLGWGHNEKWRSRDDLNIYNMENLHYARTQIIDKTTCKEEYHNFPQIHGTIDKYMICTDGDGNIDEFGERINKPPKVDGCGPNHEKLRGSFESSACEEFEAPKDPYEEVYHQSVEESSDEIPDIPHGNILKVGLVKRRDNTEIIMENNNNNNGKAQENGDNNGNGNKNGNGYNNGNGHNNGNGYSNGNGYKNGNGHKNGNGYSNGNGYNNGNGHNNGNGYSNGNGYKNGNGHKNGNGYSNGNGYKNGNGHKNGNGYKNGNGHNNGNEHKPVKSNVGGGIRGSDEEIPGGGICQNDHGGPLVTWVGAHEVLLGVATGFKITGSSACTGPYLFTSTQCNGAFIDCIINSVNATRQRRALCENPDERGFEMIERRISWMHHPAGPAENEIVHQRPQIPLSQYHYGNLG